MEGWKAEGCEVEVSTVEDARGYRWYLCVTDGVFALPMVSLRPDNGLEDVAHLVHTNGHTL